MFPWCRRRYIYRQLLPKVAGMVLVVAGAVILLARVPAYVWWCAGGALMVYVGWRLYVC